MTQVFDEQALMDRVDGDVEFLQETVTMLDEDSPSLIQAIRAAAVSRDAEALAGSAHALKGMVSNFCAAPAEAAAREVEAMGRTQQLSDVQRAVDTVQQETDRLRSALSLFLEAKRA